MGGKRREGKRGGGREGEEMGREEKVVWRELVWRELGSEMLYELFLGFSLVAANWLQELPRSCPGAARSS